ncbi:phytanoyl-CoA dioxygenase family protein [Spongorhabdus nitratireducens]
MISHNRILCASEGIQFSTQGFLIKKNFISPDSISRLQRAAEKLEQRACDNDSTVIPYTTYIHQLPWVTTETSLHAKKRNTPYFIEGIPLLSRSFDSLISLKCLWEMASRLLQNRQLSYHNTCLLFKPAYIGPKVQWHRDFMRNNILSFTSSRFLRIFIPLDRFDQHNGAPMVYPGSHRIPERAAFLRLKHRYGTHPFPHTLSCSPGDIVIINPKIRHGSGPNRSARNRTNLLLQLGTYGMTVPGSQSRELWFGMDRTGIKAAQSSLLPAA